jgi:CheY-like chemotaxis protein
MDRDARAKANILIVEDDRDMRDTLQDFFEDEGHRVFAAANGAEALKKLEELAGACVVILDLLMPVMTGLEVYSAMQCDSRLSATPVIVTTSDPSKAPSGVLVMRKPLHLARLLETVNVLQARVES